MKIILSFFILLIPSFLSGEMVCKSLGGCKIVWETGKCIGCVESEVIPKKSVDTFTPVVKVVSLTTTNKVSVNTPTSHFQYGNPTSPEQNLLTSSIHNWKHQPKSKLVNGDSCKSVPKKEWKISKCRSGCRTSRCSTLSLVCKGKCWKNRRSVHYYKTHPNEENPYDG